MHIALLFAGLALRDLADAERIRRFLRRLGRTTSSETTCIDFLSQAPAKVERGHEQDVADVCALLDRGLVERHVLVAAYEEIEPGLCRFPAVDPQAFRGRLEKLCR